MELGRLFLYPPPLWNQGGGRSRSRPGVFYIYNWPHETLRGRSFHPRPVFVPRGGSSSFYFLCRFLPHRSGGFDDSTHNVFTQNPTPLPLPPNGTRQLAHGRLNPPNSLCSASIHLFGPRSSPVHYVSCLARASCRATAGARACATATQVLAQRLTCPECTLPRQLANQPLAGMTPCSCGLRNHRPQVPVTLRTPLPVESAVGTSEKEGKKSSAGMRLVPGRPTLVRQQTPAADAKSTKASRIVLWRLYSSIAAPDNVWSPYTSGHAPHATQATGSSRGHPRRHKPFSYNGTRRLPLKGV